ncbi:endoribonuclease Dicer homolog 2 isoform X2 [Hevea brasiliensis]|uniref:endoribonuclease Dicer homolog 2 isoform X2 n=1 Tax=Hevea brasiliensis TaxID=3981 RepID=UPI0025E717F9|nr:endoribonuclease Dicer homolog 2 isoform X2 [Hevea brasiliensis]
MEPVYMDTDDTQKLAAEPLPFARSYQLEALEKALKQNTVLLLETGSGKTLVAIMLLRSYAHLLRKPSPFIAVFLVPQVVLVHQQAEAVESHTDLIVGKYCGEMGVDFRDAASWKQRLQKHEVLVMTPQILLDGLRHSFIKLDLIKVLIFDECHHASGKHPYACILTEFYHRQLSFGNCNLPRIFGMTASPIKSKGAKSEPTYWPKITELENMMHSKVYTCVSESVLAKFIPFSTPKFKFYEHTGVPNAVHVSLAEKLKILKAKYECHLKQSDLIDSAVESTSKKISKMHSTLMYCLDELGVWPAFKAAEVLSCPKSNFLSRGKSDAFGENIVKEFNLEASQTFDNCIRTGLLTTKIFCLVDSLLEYRDLNDIRCIVFVERVITAIVLQSLLSELLPRYNGWKSKYIAGNGSGLQTQTQKVHKETVEEFRKGKVNIIVATSILEEGLDVQSCNLVVRFDPSATISSFIQSRGRARMHNSDYLLMVKRGDLSTCSRLENYLSSGDIMRKESLRHAFVPCSPPKSELYDDDFYCVESTEAIVTLASSVSLINIYCFCLPSDRYFKPAPRCVIDEEREICTLLLPKSCPIETICVQGNIKTLKQKACLEACKQLHKIGALTDNLVPDCVEEEAVVKEVGNVPYDDEQPMYYPPELVSQGSKESKGTYYFYLIELNQNFDSDIPVHNIILLMRSELESNILSLDFDFELDRGRLTVKLKYIGEIDLTPEMVLICRKFLIALFKVLVDRNLNELEEILNGLQLSNDPEIDYLLLPSMGSCQKPSIDWNSIISILFSHENAWKYHVNSPLKDCTRTMWTKNGQVCKCMLQNSLVYTPHNGEVYCIEGISDHLDGRSLLKLKNGDYTSYKEYYKDKYDIELLFDQELLLRGRHIFPLHYYLLRCRQHKGKDSQNAYVELPPELCCIKMSPISISTFYSFTFVPSIMHRIESLLIAVNLKKMHLDHCTQNVVIPTIKVLEAITTKKCQEKFHLESLETLGDSFLKYAASQLLFKTYQKHHEGFLSIKKDKLISNDTLCKLGCDCKLPGFIRNESFDPKNWMVPGDASGNYSLREDFISNARSLYITRRRKLKKKKVADVVEALVGAYLSAGGEIAALLFLNWIGIKVDFFNTPYEPQFQVKPEDHIEIRHLESLLNYSFRDPSLLLEALTHGSYMLPEIPRCYQRLEFLGDAVLDYLITEYLYGKYPEISPGLLTEMRSASVNNDCYARSAVREGLHKHILYTSQKLDKDIGFAVKCCENYSSESTFGWESEISFPKVLGDVMESLAGAIFVDSGYNKDVVFRSIRPLLEPLVTLETLRLNPTKELNELCQIKHFKKKNPFVPLNNGMSSVTVEVKANGVKFKHTSTAANKKTAEKLASKEVLRVLKEKFNI